MIKECDNLACCHELKIIGEDSNCLRVLCTHCQRQYAIRKDPFKGTPEIREYVKVFRKEALQGWDSLFYKYHDNFLLK